MPTAGMCRCAWECPRPYANLGEYQEAVRKNASSSTHNALVCETLGKIHLQPPENVGGRRATAGCGVANVTCGLLLGLFC